MPLSTTQYGFIIDPLVPLTDDTGRTISNGYVRVFMAGTSTPVITYKNFDGATNEETVQLDNSGRTAYPVIGSKGSTYKVCVYDAEHSQEDPILTVDKIAVLGASINASGATIVTGLDSVTVPEENFLKATVEGTGVELALDPTEVTSDVNTISAAETAAPDYVLPLLDKTGTDDGKKISLANLFKFALDWISRLATTVTSFASGDFIAVSNTTNGTRKMSKDTLFELTAQNALAGNVAPAFDPTRDEDHKYKAWRDVVENNGKVYIFKVDHYGAWSDSDVKVLDDIDLLNLWNDYKLLPSAVYQKADVLHTESTRFVDGTGIIYEVGRVGSGLIPLSEGDIIYYTAGNVPYSTTFVASDKKTALAAASGSTSTKVIAPSGVSYVFIQYSRVLGGITYGAGLDSELKIIKADETKRLQYDDLGGKPDINAPADAVRAELVVTDEKLLPTAVFNFAKNLHYEHTRFAAGTGVVAASGRWGSGLIPVSEGDIIYYTDNNKPYSTTFIAADGKTALTAGSGSTSTKVIAPANAAYVFIQYSHEIYGGAGLDSELKLVKADETKRLQYDDLGGFPIPSVEELRNEKEIISEISKNSNRSYASEKSVSLSAAAVVSNSVSTDTFTISDTAKKKKVIALLHRRAKGDFTKANDFYIPNASKNFGDVVFEDENGNRLPFDVLSYGNYDIIHDSRLKIKNRVRYNSHGQVFGADEEADKLYVSSDNGENWTEILPGIASKIDVALCCNDDSILFATTAGKLYRSEYPYNSAIVVLDVLAEVGYFSDLSSNHFAKTSSGVIFCGSYQEQEKVSKFFKSTDNGQTWTTIFQDTEYQHVHRVTIDEENGAPVVYVGMDGGCGLYVSHDLGETWVDLRATIPDLPYVTDHGLIYSEPGLRLFGGETSYQNKANSLIKSSDDVHFEPILAFGKAVYSVEKKNGFYFAATVSEANFQTNGLLVSKDLKNWETASISAYENSDMSSGGYKMLSIIGDEIWAFCRNDWPQVGYQSRIFTGGDNYCAFVVIDVPAGVSSITAKTGVIPSYIRPCRLDDNGVADVLDIPLNESGKFALATFNGESKVLDVGGGHVANGGRHITDIYPPLGNFEDKFSAIISKANNQVFEGSLPANYTISFWMCMDNRAGSRLRLICGERYELVIRDYRLYLVDKQSNTLVYENLFSQAGQKKVMQKYDLSVNSDGTFNMYANGRPQTRTYSWLMPDFGNSLSFLNYESGAPLVLQHFEIRSGVITDDEALIGYHGGIYDGLNFG